MTATARKLAHKPVAKNARARLLSMQWALRPDVLTQMLAIAERRNFDLGAIAKELGTYQEGSWATTVRDGVAYIPVNGVLSRYMSWFTAICGGTSYEYLGRDIAKAVHDPTVRAVVLDVDSPGGEVNGASDLAQLIVNLRGDKPLVACISGDGCSAAYWVASAASRVVAVDTALVGSIGVVASFLDDRAYMEKEGFREIEIVSSQSPNKRVDPATDDGRAQIQRVVDALADRFIDAVAEQRGVTRDAVLSGFGQGDIFVGREAAARDMVDGITTMEALHAELSAPATPRLTITGATSMATKAKKKQAANTDEETPATTEAEETTDDEDEDAESTETEETATGGEEEAEEGEEEEEEETDDDAPADDDEDEEYSGARRDVKTVSQLRAAFPDLTARVAKSERDRILAIIDLTPAGQEKLARQCIESGVSVGAAAKKFLKTATGTQRSRLEAFTTADRTTFTPPATQRPKEPDSASSTVERILAAGRVARGEPAPARN